MKRLLIPLFAVGCASAPPPNLGDPNLTQVEVGQRAYAHACAGCHGDAGEGGRAIALLGEGSLPATRDGRPDFRTAADLLAWLPVAMPPRERDRLAPAEYAAIVAFVLEAHGVDLQGQNVTEDNAAQWALQP
jgi:mono/diheme cytochrome c family protein